MDGRSHDAPLKVLIDCRMANWTGIGRYTVGLSRALAARDDVSLVVLEGKDAPRSVRSLRSEHVKGVVTPFSPGGMRELSKVIDQVAPDVTHVPHFPTPLPMRHPLVVTMHDVTPLVVPDSMPSAAKRWVYRKMMGRAANVADALICSAEHAASDMERFFPASKGKLTVIPLAADDFASSDFKVAIEPILHYCEGPYLLSMGSTRPHKDLATLLRAFSEVVKDHPDVSLLLVGPPDEGFVSSVLDGRSRVIDRVRFTGRISDDELRSLYSGAQAFVFPSTYEGFGLPPLEAMAMGAPVISSDAASLPEVVGDAAVVIKAGDVDAFAAAIHEVLDDAEARDRLIEAGKKRAAGFSWARTAEATVGVYRKVAR